MKYPRTSYWPWSPQIPADGLQVADPSVFVGLEVVVTEKLDGSNTLLHRGEVYGRSVSTPSSAPWPAPSWSASTPTGSASGNWPC